MKKTLLLFIMCALLPRVAEAQTPTDDTFTVSDLTFVSDNIYSVTIGFNGSRLYTAYNLEITMPQGLDVMYVESDGKKMAIVDMYEEDDSPYPYTQHPITKKKTFKHSVTGQVDASGDMRIVCISNENAVFTKTEGSLFTFYITLDESIFTSSYSPKPIVRLSGLNLTTSASVKYVPADFACRPFTTGIPTERTLPVNVSAANKVGTLILPFDAELPSGLKAYSCNATEGDLLTLTPAESIEACTPYIVYAENGYSGNLSGTAELPDPSNVTDVFTNGLLTGLLTSGVVNTGYILQNKGEGPVFYDAEGVNFSLPAGRCYLTSSAGSVKAFQFAFDDDATGIKTLSNSPLKGESVYDLSGRQVLAPKHGIYIQGTHKVIVK